MSYDKLRFYNYFEYDEYKKEVKVQPTSRFSLEALTCTKLVLMSVFSGVDLVYWALLVNTGRERSRCTATTKVALSV